ncbi:MAG TPA: B12-binding domain-containing radical SAM protein, partial [Mitsuokella multacida]|nr:B12-binding domain-containing radical SAM protein [Mitsuokella multacida]
MDWELKQELKKQLQEEQGYYVYPVGTRTRFALVYPNSYFVGMSNLGFHIIYDLLNKRSDTACERVFLPERTKVERYVNTRTPIMSMETQSPLYDFDVLGFAVSFEMDYFNILQLLSMGKVKAKAAERGERDPILVAGGPCPTFNPEPLAAIFDAFIIGEGEVIMPALMDAYQAAKREGLPRNELLQKLAEMPGVYVPSLYEQHYDDEGHLTAIEPLPGAPAAVSRQWVHDLDAYPAHTVVVTDNTEFNFYLIETARGCGRHCRFCMAGYCYRRPRVRPLEYVKSAVLRGKALGKKIGLMGAAISDYPYIDELVTFIRDQGLAFSCASLRADSITPAIVKGLAESGQKTITLAPEAGSKHMRDIINKGITEEHLLHSIDLATAAGIRHVRMYIMVGLPMETDDDIQGIVDMTRRVQQHMAAIGNLSRITLSINPFIPKPFTPFQWMAMTEKKVVEKRLNFLKKALKDKQIELLIEPLRSAYIQGVLSRGDRRVGDLLV